MTDTQRKAIDDLECIIRDATDLIRRLENDEIDDIDDATYRAYRIISDI